MKVGVISVALSVALVPAVARGETVTLMPGVVFVGDGGVEAVEAADGLVVAKMWRPLVFNDGNQLISGRMDCRAAAVAEAFRPELFDLANVHASHLALERYGKGKELDRRIKADNTVRRLDVTLRRAAPDRYSVISYWAVRTGDRLVSIRRNCAFLRGQPIWRQNFLADADRYSAIRIDLPPPAIADPALASSLDTLTDS